MSTTALAALHGQADGLLAHGGTVTKKFETVRTRWEALHAKPDHVGSLAAMIVGDDDVDPRDLTARLAAAHSAAIARSQTLHTADVLNDLAARVLVTQRAEWKAALPENYTRAATAYNAAAAALVKTLDAVDFDAPAETLLSEPARIREAWGKVPELVAALDGAAEAVTFIADASRVETGPASLGVLTRIPGAADRRAVWEALDGEHGRAGVWGTLHRLGAELVAPASLNDVQPYRRAKQMEVRYLRTATGLRPVDYDPETNTPSDAIPAATRGW